MMSAGSATKLTGAQLDRILFQNYDKILVDIRVGAANQAHRVE